MNHQVSTLIKRCLGGSFILVVILMIINVYLSAAVAQDGLMIDSLSKHQELLKRDISQLEQTITSKTSLADLSSKANANGYQKADKVISITNTLPVTANAR